MAYLPTRFRDENDPSQVGAAPPGNTGPGVGGGGGPPVGTGPTQVPVAGPSGFPGIRAYFAANQDQATAMGRGLASGYESEAQRAQDAASAYPVPPPSAPGGPAYVPPPGTPKPADPVELAREAARTGGALKDPGGLAALLSQRYGGGGMGGAWGEGTVYTPGMASFDAALIGGAGYAPIQSALDKWSGVVGSLGGWKPPEAKPPAPTGKQPLASGKGPPPLPGGAVPAKPKNPWWRT